MDVISDNRSSCQTLPLLLERDDEPGLTTQQHNKSGLAWTQLRSIDHTKFCTHARSLVVSRLRFLFGFTVLDIRCGIFGAVAPLEGRLDC